MVEDTQAAAVESALEVRGEEDHEGAQLPGIDQAGVDGEVEGRAILAEGDEATSQEVGKVEEAALAQVLEEEIEDRVKDRSGPIRAGGGGR